ncbi:hypothetical protein QR90_08690 [Deinococcus radiopugnans]|uniref:Uncharacterized protein n=1 Tax=Deinococcus radiopugnans TaxID=57497 RepID=A0A0A7KIV3_9DEIO|nr:hypothetical protein QR90_08690 [Deinococcus radiopugnans]
MRSSTALRCAPRSEPAKACTSSMITNRRSANSRSTGTRRPISIASRLSGVVSSSSAGSARKCWRAAAPTPPCHLKARRPSRPARVTARSSWLFSRATRGLTYSAPTPPMPASRASTSITGRNAASVLPPAVGASTTTFSPARMGGMLTCWTGHRPCQRN